MKTTQATAQEIYNELFNLVGNKLEYYKEDLTKHDQNTIKNSPGKSFIHITRKTGTHLTPFHGLEDYPKTGNMMVKYLFGATNRKGLLKGNIETLEHYLNNEPLAIYFFNGKELKKVKALKALQIYKDHLNSLVNTWEEEERQQQQAH